MTLILGTCLPSWQNYQNQTHDTDIGGRLSDKKDKFECLLFGWIRLMVEDKFVLNIPYYLKKLCLDFYGNIIMESNILDINQTNIIGWILKQKLNDDYKIKYFAPKIICDSQKHGFDKDEIEKQCDKNWNNTMVVIKTNNDNIYAQFYGFKKDIDFGCYLKCSFKTKPIIWEDDADKFHFPNDFNVVLNKTITDSFIKSSEVNAQEIAYLARNDIPNDIEIKHFEIFRI